jgi:polyhydroxyalkanoate synthesis regulator phasin
MNERINQGLKKALYTGIGAAALTVDITGKAIDTLAKKGEQAIEKGRAMNEELKRKKAQAEVDIKDMAESLTQMSKEDIEVIRARLSEVESTMGKAAGELKVSAAAIMTSLEKMGREELEVVKAKIEEIKASWKDDDEGAAE